MTRAGATDRRRATIGDVARHAGVSVGTVSNVLSGARRVRPETRARVEKACEELDFRPNRVARALSQRRTHTIGMVVPDVTNPFFGSLMLTVEQALAERGYAVVFGNAGNDGVVERRYLLEFAERGVDGLVAATAGVEPETLLAVASQIPTVLVDRVIDGWPGDTVVDDDRAGMRAVIEHLDSLGHDRIALLEGEHGLSTSRERHEAVRGALTALGLDAHAASAGPFTLESGYARACELLDGGDLPSAVCASNDLLAMATLRAAAERGIAVPEALSVTGYDDIAFAAYTAPPLTTVRQRTGRIAEEIVDVLLARIGDRDAPERHVVVAPELVVRSSTAERR